MRTTEENIAKSNRYNEQKKAPIHEEDDVQAP